MSQSINDIQDELIEEFGLFDDPMDQYEYIIDIGKKMPPLAEVHKVDENIVKGCQSTVWLHAYSDAGKVMLEADSNTVITKGLIALLLRVLSGHTPEEILNAELYFVDKIGLRAHLSSQRSNGLTAMMKKIKTYAIAFATANNNAQ